jgi:hypothetical protein
MESKYFETIFLFVIPAKAGIQIFSVISAKSVIQMFKTGFPRIKSGAGSVEPGMTARRINSILIVK